MGNNPFEIKERLLVRNSLVTLFTNGVYVVCALVMMPLVIRSLGVERFGIFSLTAVVLWYFNILDLGLGRATTKFVAESLGKGQEEKVSGYLGTSVFFQGVLGGIGSAILFFATPFLVDHLLRIPVAYRLDARFCFYVVACSIPVVIISASFRGVLEARQRFDLINAVQLPVGILTFALPLGALYLGMGLFGMVLSLFLLKVVVLGWWVGFCKLRLSFSKEYIRPLFGFGVWVMLSGTMMPVLLTLDRLLIGVFSGVAQVAYYTAPYEAVTRLWIIPASIASVLFPAFSSLDGKGELKRIKSIFRSSAWGFMMISGTVACFLFFFAHKILSLWLGADFARHSVVVFQILAVGFFMHSLANLPHALIQARGRPDVITKLQCIETLFYIPLVWFSVKRWGIVGAASAWTVRVGVDMFLCFWASRKLFRINLL
ncbi:MAG: flippase [Candidatus Omnitrophica bacterium]|nr:flippase [Candidatus Omnitrophota bacterium]